jgi:hypothetical protein
MKLPRAVKRRDAARPSGSEFALPVRVGSPVWVFDINRRVYPPPEKGRSSSGPIWREHWVPFVIVGETSRSWLLDDGGSCKVPKRGADPRRVLFSQADVERATWVHDNAYAISQAINSLAHRDGGLAYETLRTIASAVGYQPKTENK